MGAILKLCVLLYMFKTFNEYNQTELPNLYITIKKINCQFDRKEMIHVNLNIYLFINKNLYSYVLWSFVYFFLENCLPCPLGSELVFFLVNLLQVFFLLMLVIFLLGEIWFILFYCSQVGQSLPY